MIKLTVIIPVYNEIKTIENLLNQVLELKISKQIIIVDDFSTDGTKKVLFQNRSKVDKIIYHKKNLGKGASIKSAQKFVKGEYVVIQDADLEYSPKDLKKLIKYIDENKLDVVYGSRVLNKDKFQNIKNFTHFIRIWGNIFLTKFSNFINNQNLTDAHTCYKMFKSSLFKKIILKEKRFSFCPEVTTKISNLNIKILEYPISYNGRTYNEGKKIKSTDGISAIYAIIKYKFFD